MLEIFMCFHWALPTNAKGCSMRVQALGRGQQKTKTLEPYMLEICMCFHWALSTKAKGCSMRVQALGRKHTKDDWSRSLSFVALPPLIGGRGVDEP